MPKQFSPTTYQAAARAHSKVMAARREMSAEEEPMHRWSHPLPQPQVVRAPAAECAGDTSAAMTQVLEALAAQNQLLVDLLGAVNALTAATLCRCGKV